MTSQNIHYDLIFYFLIMLHIKFDLKASDVYESKLEIKIKYQSFNSCIIRFNYTTVDNLIIDYERGQQR